MDPNQEMTNNFIGMLAGIFIIINTASAIMGIVERLLVGPRGLVW